MRWASPRELRPGMAEHGGAGRDGGVTEGAKGAEGVEGVEDVEDTEEAEDVEEAW